MGAESGGFWHRQSSNRGPSAISATAEVPLDRIASRRRRSAWRKQLVCEIFRKWSLRGSILETNIRVPGDAMQVLRQKISIERSIDGAGGIYG